MTASDFQKLFKVIAKNTSCRDEVLRVQADGEVVTMASGEVLQGPSGRHLHEAELAVLEVDEGRLTRESPVSATGMFKAEFP